MTLNRPTKIFRNFALLSALAMALAACSPEVGSKKWCENMKEKPKGDWTSNEVADFTKHCLF